MRTEAEKKRLNPLGTDYQILHQNLVLPLFFLAMSLLREIKF